ncbi:MAG: flavohemoglobin expression-modulating QEGLA motif protein [Sandaracinaceae bacterium]|nr:flavohemoglobin expression-modulating QEGLA motif protein [Sandaracinaceae bacterium]
MLDPRRSGSPPFDRALVELAKRARVLPALHPRNAADERAGLAAELEAGRMPVPRWEPLERRDVRGLVSALDRIRHALERELPTELVALYAARLDELELDVALLDALGDPRRVRPIAARRFGTGREVIDGRALEAHARALLAHTPSSEDPPTIEARGLAAMMERASRAVGLAVTVRVDPRLSAGAAAGDHTIFVQERRFGPIEARRLVAHEVLGHAVAGARGAREPLAIFEVGSAGSFADQEGLAIVLEEHASALDGARLRVLAARVLATDLMHDGASFGDAARALVERAGLSSRVAITTAERAYRGGGVARDAGYLAGWLRVRGALARGEATIDELRAGRLGLAALPALRWAYAHGRASRHPSIDLDGVLREAGCPEGTAPAPTLP